jgi:CRISPR-associated protein Cmr5
LTVTEQGLTPSTQTSNQLATHRQNIEQERGRVAWQRVLVIKTNPSKDVRKEYRSLARGLNAMIQINGLGQTLGFFYAKGKNDSHKAHTCVLQHLTDWMCGEDQQKQPHFSAANREVLLTKGLLAWVTDSETSSADYRRATTECLAFGVWLSRFAEAELEDAAEQGKTNG